MGTASAECKRMAWRLPLAGLSDKSTAIVVDVSVMVMSLRLSAVASSTYLTEPCVGSS